jgi:hypothetical protein
MDANSTARYVRVVKEIQSRLLYSPSDIAHDIFHHFVVWQNTKYIMWFDEIKPPNVEFLELAVWGHDMELEDHETVQVFKIMRAAGYSLEEIAEVTYIINSHAYVPEENQVIEAQILFDADKIEYVNPHRWVWIGENIKNGQFPVKKATAYMENLRDKLPLVIEQVRFRATKLKMYDYLREFINMYEHIQNEYGDWINVVPKQILINNYGRLELLIK